MESGTSVTVFDPTMSKTSVQSARTAHRADAHHALFTLKSLSFITIRTAAGKRPPPSVAQRVGFEPTDTSLHHTISNSSNLLIEMIEHVLFFHADLSHVKPAQNHVLYRKAKVCGDIDRLQK